MHGTKLCLSVKVVSFLLFLSSLLFFLPNNFALADEKSNGAVAWATKHIGDVQLGNFYYNNGKSLCLAFVEDAYQIGGGLSIPRGGSSESALSFWNSHLSLQNKNDRNPPAGAFVFWGANTANADGHVALSIGGGRVISTYERSLTFKGIHSLLISDRDSIAPYLGWLAPPGVNLVLTSSTGINHVLRVSATGTAYFEDASGLHWIQNGTIYGCLTRKFPLWDGLTQGQVNALGNGKPWATCKP